MISFIKGFVLPRTPTGCMGYDGAMFCHAAGFTNYDEIENANFRGGSYVKSESGQHSLIFSGFFEDDLLDEPSDTDETTYFQRLMHITPKALELYTFELEITHDDMAKATDFLMARVDLLSVVYSEVFDMDDAGQRLNVSVQHIEG